MLQGRRKITSDYTSEDLKIPENVVSMVRGAMYTHALNAEEIQYLIDYKNGSQTILDKEKLVRPEINNTSVFNHASMITRNINGYFLGTPIQYIPTGYSNKRDEVEDLNRYLSYENKFAVDGELGEMSSICGTAYRLIYTDGEFADEVPFEEEALDPTKTFVVYSNSVGEMPLAGVTIYDIISDNGLKTGSYIYVYTDSLMYVFEGDSLDNIDILRPYEVKPYNVGGVPIIEYPNNQWRLGDWELAIDLMDAINSLQNSRLDDIEQFIQQLLVFVNADIDDEKYAEMRQAGIVVLKNQTNDKVDIKAIDSALDQTGISQFSQELEDLLYAIVGIPDRNNRSGGGGDTGAAVELRDGWADMEVIARNKEMTFKRSEKRALRIMLTILRNKSMSTLSLLDVDVKFSRNKTNNLLVKAQAYKNLVDSKTLSVEDALDIVNLVSDPSDYVARGRDFWGSAFAGIESANISVEQGKVSLENAKNPQPDENTSQSAKTEQNSNKK